ncbi:hypothetical protein FMO003_27470 [Moritella sp. F3]|nr:hypothetical protein FMO001_30330 [Moritella sp. F1]GIC82466.1 hypothetical protein FMO003_27470 [Moritella sp. F3]
MAFITKNYIFRGIYNVYYGFFELYILLMACLFEGIINFGRIFMFLGGALNEYAIQ